jgi:hypothetical protein
MKQAFKLAGTSLMIWVVVLIPICIVTTVMVNATNREAVDYKQGKITSISTPKMEKYEEERKEFFKLAMITSLVISQTAVVTAAFMKVDESNW